MLGIAVYCAILDAVHAAGPGRAQANLTAPCTPEAILRAVKSVAG